MDENREHRNGLERDRRADRILRDALDLPSVERVAFVVRSSPDDPDLVARVLRLIDAAEDDDPRLATAAPLRGELAEALFDGDDEDAALDRTVGAYRLLRPLGRGGSATVFLAERNDGAFDQRVAIKVVRSGAGVAPRFEQERQILAGLQHPCIAALLDGGTTSWGRPFLVVEHVQGRSIDLYCRETRLALRERLRLFLDVAGAVEHAHRHLVVHRDIKPSNILVTEEGRVKLLDFGIAKLLDPSIAAASSRTDTVARWMTPRYASPEQLLAGPITTASDVYQLGLLLYELVTGEPAFHEPTSSPSALIEAARNRVSVRPGDVTAVPEDLDAIVMAATRPEPDRRYASVALLANDVRAFLARRPVSARGDSVSYRARRFVERHRAGVALSTAIVVAVLAFVTAITWGFVRVGHERDRAQATGAFLADTLRAAQPQVALGRDTAILKALLEDAIARIDTRLADEPYAAAEVHGIVAETLRTLSEYERAEVHARAAVEGFESGLGADASETLRARHVLGLTLWDQGRYEDAENALREVVERALDPDLRVLAVSSLGLAVRAQGRLDEAEPLYRRAVDLARERFGESAEQTIGAIGNLAFLLAELDRLDEAEPYAREAAELSREHLGSDNPDTYLAIDKLAALLGQRGREDEALDLHREAYAGLRRVLGDRHSTTLGSAYSTAIVLRRTGRFAEAIATLERIVPIVREEFGPESRFLFPTLNELGRSLTASGRPGDALPHLLEAREVATAVVGPDHYLHAVVSVSLADAYIEVGDPAAAGPLLRDARTTLEAAFGTAGTHRYFDELTRVEAKRIERSRPRR